VRRRLLRFASAGASGLASVLWLAGTRTLPHGAVTNTVALVAGCGVYGLVYAGLLWTDGGLRWPAWSRRHAAGLAVALSAPAGWLVGFGVLLLIGVSAPFAAVAAITAGVALPVATWLAAHPTFGDPADEAPEPAGEDLLGRLGGVRPHERVGRSR
jgi:hypothetical protein